MVFGGEPVPAQSGAGGVERACAEPIPVLGLLEDAGQLVARVGELAAAPPAQLAVGVVEGEDAGELFDGCPGTFVGAVRGVRIVGLDRDVDPGAEQRFVAVHLPRPVGHVGRVSRAHGEGAGGNSLA